MRSHGILPKKTLPKWHISYLHGHFGRCFPGHSQSSANVLMETFSPLSSNTAIYFTLLPTCLSPFLTQIGINRWIPHGHCFISSQCYLRASFPSFSTITKQSVWLHVEPSKKPVKTLVYIIFVCLLLLHYLGYCNNLCCIYFG